jgi:hypothetical protein
MTLFTIYPHCKADESDDDLTEWATRLGQAGVDYVRVFSGWEDREPWVAPFLKDETQVDPDMGPKYDLTKINPEYIRLLQRFQRILGRTGVGILFDFFPSQLCRRGYPFAFWDRLRNINGVESVYDTTDHALALYKFWMMAVADMIGVEGNLWKFGNEMQAPGDNGDWVNNNSDVNLLKAWAEKWGGTLGYFLRDELGVKMPLSCSQENYAGTGQKLSNYFLDVKDWPLDNILCHIHIGTWPAFMEYWRSGEERRYSLRKRYCISDDGVGFSGLNSVPEDQRGTCSEGREWYGGYVGPKCSGNVEFRTNFLRQLLTVFEDRLKMWEAMPQVLHNKVHRLNDIDQEMDINVYWKATQTIWGVDIRRSF